MDSIKTRLLNTISSIQYNDERLADELYEVRKQGDIINEASLKSMHLESLAGEGPEILAPGGVESNFTLETIVLRVGRPVLNISRNEAVLQFKDAESQVWKERLEKAKPKLISAIHAVGRIELQYDPSFEWIGTGWLVAEDIVVTNRHVAEVFGRNTGNEFVFRQGVGGRRINAFIDFLEEAENPEELTFTIVSILHIESEAGPDIAFMRVELRNSISAPIKLSEKLPNSPMQVAVIGYPARDSRLPDQQLMFDIFGDVYNKKRLAPGQITGSCQNEIYHDCSTLGGNSGSVVLDLESGEAVGLHFAGRFLERNFAVPATLIKNKLATISRTPKRNIPQYDINISPSKKETSEKDDNSIQDIGKSENTLTTFVIPLHISVSIGSTNKGDISSPKIIIK